MTMILSDGQHEHQAMEAFSQGVERLLNQQYEKVQANFQQVTELTPEFPGGYYNLGLSLVGQEKLGEGFEAFKAALQLAPEHPGCNLSAGKCALSLDRPEEALERFTIALRLGPSQHLH